MEEPNQETMSSQDKSLLEDYVARAYHVIYDENSKIADIIANNPMRRVDLAASSTLAIARKLDLSRQEEKKPPYPDMVKVLGGVHILEKIIEFSEQKGGEAFSQEEIQTSMKKAMQKYIEMGIKDRSIDPVALARSVEEAQPGAVKEALSDVPDDSTGSKRQPGQQSQSQGPQPEQPQIPPQDQTQSLPQQGLLQQQGGM